MPSVFSLSITQCNLKFLFIFVFLSETYIGFGLMCCSTGNFIITSSLCRFNSEYTRPVVGLAHFGYLVYFSGVEKNSRYVFGSH